MTISVSDAIEAESFFKVTVGTGGKITTEQLTALQTYVADDVNNFVGTRAVSTDVKTRITACFILDLYANKGGKGTVVQESVTDASAKYQIKTTSQYMDRAYSLRDNSDSNNYKFASVGVSRSDAPNGLDSNVDSQKFLFGDW